MKWHDLKTDPAVFDAVADGSKTHEIRYNDRDFKVGDGLLLRRTRDTGWAMKTTGAPLMFTGEEYRAVVTHVLDGYGLMPGWVILSIKPYGVTPCRPAMTEQGVKHEDTALLDHIQHTVSTVELLPGNRFRIGGLHAAVSSDLRDAIRIAAAGVLASDRQTFSQQTPMEGKPTP